MSRVRTADKLHPLPLPPATIHFIGIGGISMSGLATMLLDKGYAVSGSDIAESAQTQLLRARGVEIVLGHHDPGLAERADIVVSTRRAELNAATELAGARATGSLIVKRGQLLAMIADDLICVAVAGTHGKSTTTAMITSVLVDLGLDPSYAVGATMPALGTNTAAGSGPHMTIEADEFDRSFLWLRPDVAVVTSVSFDHPDIYADQDDYDAAFLAFARGIAPGGPRRGTLVLAADDPGCRRLHQALIRDGDPGFDVVTFGEADEADWRLESDDDGWTFVDDHGKRHRARLNVAGRHNARNAIAAIAALAALEIEPERSIPALTRFTGVGRRFEHKGRIHHVDVIDDYAHHPEEIAAVLSAARDLYPGRRIVAVHQPHTYTRTKTLLDGFVSALNGADQIVLLDLYPSGETDTLGVSSRDILDRLGKPAQAASGPEDAAARTAALARHGDVVLTLGAGDITRTGALLLEHLTNRESPSDTKSEVTAPVTTPRQARRKPEPGFAVPGHPRLVVKPDADMSLYTTMRLGGSADFLIRATTAEDIVVAQEWALQERLPVSVIGGGSNLLVGDKGIRGLVIVARTTGERASGQLTIEDRDDSVVLTVDAQAPLSWVGRYCAEHGWAGMDWGVGLPGQIGGATVNNAGAHGTELKDNLVAIDVLLDSGEIARMPATWLEAAYRMTKIKGTERPRPWTVLRSVFELTKDDPTKLVALADEHADFRKRTQPTGACSGSTFTNPPGDYAGRLLEEAGLKGYTVGAMQFSPKHANWVVNTGGGTARDAWALIQHARSVVKERYDIELHPEIERIGEHLD